MLGLFLLPVLLTLSPWTLMRRTAHQRPGLTAAMVLAFGVVPTLGVVALASSDPIQVQLGNVISIDPFMPLALRVALSLIGLASFTSVSLVLVACVDGRRTMAAADRRTLGGLALVALPYSAFLLVGTLLSMVMSDRYWLVVIALAALGLARAVPLVSDPTDVTATASSGAGRRWGVGLSVALLALYGLAVCADTAALRAGGTNFATAVAATLPPGDGPLDISMNPAWDGSFYTADPARLGVLRHGEFRYAADDGTRSFFYVATTGTGAGVCSPYAVRTTTQLTGPVPHALIVSSISRGLFGSLRFFLIHQSVEQGAACR
jgi:hypothetical protein